MIFVDSNVPMYLVGVDHPYKVEARRWLERLATEQQRLVTSSEVFQEILHRYVSIRRREAIEDAFRTLRGIVDEVLAVEEGDVFAARTLVQANLRLSARHAIHVAVMQRHGMNTVFSFDAGFDLVAGMNRIPSARRA
ncbi:MAG TPA: type II toxin-antitoxin system VapC family toxin [Chloroflexota bacterium]|nr:type II toxin-antitoxin system VapC family toxin [Chloroflexota bacterium]